MTEEQIKIWKDMIETYKERYAELYPGGGDLLRN